MTKQARLANPGGKASAGTDAPVDKKKLLDEALRRRIVTMELAPGAVVDEIALSEEFGVSRPPVRELMRQLAAEGYIELEPNRPARVSPMSYQSLRSFFLAAPLIYVAVAQLAATHATPENIKHLEKIQESFRQAVEDRDVLTCVFNNDQLHYEIGKMAHNDYLMPSLRRLLLDHTRLEQAFYEFPETESMRNDMALTVTQHDLIIAAIARHDVNGVGDIVKEHWELSRKMMTEYVVPEGVHVSLQL